MDISADVSNSLLRAQAAQAPEQALADRAARARSREEIDKIALDFEAMALAQFLAPMFAELETEPPFGGGHGEEVMRSMLVEEYAREIAAAGGVGIADQLRAELLRAQENSQRDGAYAAPKISQGSE